MIFEHGFWLAGSCAARQSDARFENLSELALIFNMEIS